MTLHPSIRLRWTVLTAAIVGMVCHCLFIPPLQAQEWSDSVDWNLPTGNETLETPSNEAQNPNSLALPQSPPPAYQQKGFQFKNLFKKKEPPVDVDKLMQVGPRQYADTTGSLLRLFAPVCLNGLTLPSGIYLAQLQRGATATAATAVLSQAGRTLIILPLSGQPFATDAAVTTPTVSIQDGRLLIQDKTHVWVADFPACQATRY
ncbi:MAG: hypothetical protein QE263_09235 [Vampirovibrionales bacterium]|nr:hypothetical protein [Vampirovibrionales bacterium]